MLPDGTEITVEERDCFVALTGAVFGNLNEVGSRQNEIDELCRNYVERCCPVAGRDGALEGILPVLFAYSDRQGDFEAEWKRLLGKIRRIVAARRDFRNLLLRWR